MTGEAFGPPASYSCRKVLGIIVAILCWSGVRQLMDAECAGGDTGATDKTVPVFFDT